MRHRNVLGYLLVLLLAYVVGLAGTVATGWVVITRLSPPAAVTLEAPAVVPQAPVAPESATIDC